MKFTIDLDHKKALGIKMNEYIFLKEVSILQAWKVGACTKSNAKFAEDYDMSRSAIVRMTNRLVDKGLLSKGKGTHKRATDKFLRGVAKVSGECSETLQEGVAKRSTSRSETLPKTVIEAGSETVTKEYTDEFERFWTEYGKVGNKKQASRAWQKLSQQQKDSCMASLPKYKAYLSATGISPKHGSTYLNKQDEHWATDWRHMKTTYTRTTPTATTSTIKIKNVKSY